MCSSRSKVLELGLKDELSPVLSVRSSNRDKGTSQDKVMLKVEQKGVLREEIRPDQRGSDGSWALCIVAVQNDKKQKLMLDL